MAFSLLTIAVVLVVFLIRRSRSAPQPSLITQSIDRPRYVFPNLNLNPNLNSMKLGHNQEIKIRSRIKKDRHSMTQQSLIRPLVRALHPYVPGEQPKIKGLIKLNTNENPYPPSPKVLAAVKSAVDGRLRLYPNPTADALRARLAKLHPCQPENIIVGNGSDELLALATRAFVEPGRGVIQFFTPSYSLYPVLAEIHGASHSSGSFAG